MKPQFDHEKLNVYQQALGFVTWATQLLSKIQPKAEELSEYLTPKEQE